MDVAKYDQKAPFSVFQPNFFEKFEKNLKKNYLQINCNVV